MARHASQEHDFLRLSLRNCRFRLREQKKKKERARNCSGPLARLRHLPACLALTLVVAQVRKIRCDALPDGCTHCTQQNLECYVTDRVTGRTERRGYLAQLEREKNALTTHIQDLEKLLEQKGVQVRQWQPPSAFGNGHQFDLEHDGTSKEAWTQFRSLWIKDRSAQPGGYSGGEAAGQQSGRASPALLPSTVPRPLGAHIGVLKDNAPLSTINGTKMSILGSTIDITSFEAPDMDGPPAGTSSSTPIYNKSLQSFYNSIAKVNPQIDVPLPSREDAFSYSEWYFCMVGSFVPVLHKPTYFTLVSTVILSFFSIFL